MGNSAIIAREMRGGIIDNIHRGSMVIADTDGNVLAAVGDPEKVAFIRSAGKPLQALALIERGGAERYRLTPAEVAIICASHCGGPLQVETVRGILAKVDVPESALLSGSGIEDNCSGKHSGMLALAKMLGEPLGNYLDREHRIQRFIQAAVSETCGLPEADMGVAIDGCGAPIFAMPLRNMATGYARLANPDGLPPARAEACRKIVPAMQAHPEMVGGLDLRPLTGNKLVAKSGAAGCYCAGMLGRNAGFAMKIDDGNAGAVRAACFEMLRREGYVTEDEHARFAAGQPNAIKNRAGAVVGAWELAF